MYMDKLDGRIDFEFFDRKAAEFRSEQCRIMQEIEAHRVADKSYIEEGSKSSNWPTVPTSCSKLSQPGKTETARFCIFELYVKELTTDRRIPSTV